MTLNTPLFLFVFLPVFLLAYFTCPCRYKQYVLLVFSLLFYLWSEPLYFPLMIALAGFNAIALKRIHASVQDANKQKRWAGAGITVNLVALTVFKLMLPHLDELALKAAEAGFRFPGGATLLLPLAGHLPLGVSFFTFQEIAMLVDAVRDTPTAKPKWTEIFTHLFMFPKVIAGPIADLGKMRDQMRQPEISLKNTASGLRRFMLGFAKKTLIADQLGLVTGGGLFALDPALLPARTAWLGLVCYSLQIYFDFCAYSDMAIGLGKVMGFRFPENFRLPYSAESITDFWRRWHMTLTGWFRQYVFFPMERRRGKAKGGRQTLNILIVFALTGLWHGITPPFIAWGLWHGAALTLERGRFGAWVGKQPKIIRHIYTLGVILSGWVLFFSPDLAYAKSFAGSLMNVFSYKEPLTFSAFPPFSHAVWIALAAGVLLCIPMVHLIRERAASWCAERRHTLYAWAHDLAPVLFFIIGIIIQAGTHYFPFIYGVF